VAGKTGTTNDYTDAWFIGFSPSITCGVWIGFDEKKALGKDETGGHTALPIWIDFMRAALTDPMLKNEAFLAPADNKKQRALAVRRAAARVPVRPGDAEAH
jgi:penicillin-binding protein 1A